jgi:hypothetical protein
MLQEKLESNEDLFVATVNLLTSAAHYQVEIIYIVNLIIGISLFFFCVEVTSLLAMTPFLVDWLYFSFFL